ncbi:HPr family phosphocarrier protein [Haloterrigena salifodinae]|uniref:HPr family phosphocarrier protein n=1 Tax=Haloterrigena salifodinae TaxID=2675099 RepID=A0A8T8DXW6_9EURY|nr:phosphocarrier protein HPr [Haloterrigena salifodinae]QRV14182.1 HPr family phosphocarrier protein [Haloterrigena salifodinae]
MERTVTVVPEDGLHARPAAKFVETASEFDADVRVAPANGDDPVDAASMLAVTSLGVASGEDVRLIAEGDDAEAALDDLEELLTTPETESAAESSSGT